jgi:hypothetical protein
MRAYEFDCGLLGMRSGVWTIPWRARLHTVSAYCVTSSLSVLTVRNLGCAERLRPDEGFHQPSQPGGMHPTAGRQSALSRAW